MAAQDQGYMLYVFDKSSSVYQTLVMLLSIDQGWITSRKSGVNAIQLSTVECCVHCTTFNKLNVIMYPLELSPDDTQHDLLSDPNLLGELQGRLGGLVAHILLVGGFAMNNPFLFASNNSTTPETTIHRIHEQYSAGVDTSLLLCC